MVLFLAILLCFSAATGLHPNFEAGCARRSVLSLTPAVLATVAGPAASAAPAASSAKAPAAISTAAYDASLKPLYKAAVFARKSRRYAPGEVRQSGDFEQGMESPFVGDYSDPNHPGGSRTVSLLNEKVGVFRRAVISGNDGAGQPQFDLPALVYNDQITVDFRPKGGPDNLTGYWASNGIKWPDGNKWPRVYTPSPSA